MNIQNVKVIVIGALNTDIIALGIEKFLSPGQQTVSGKLKISPGGKSRNIAQMISLLIGKGRVAMIGRTSRDKFNLWKIPVKSEARRDVSGIPSILIAAGFA